MIRSKLMSRSLLVRACLAAIIGILLICPVAALLQPSAQSHAQSQNSQQPDQASRPEKDLGAQLAKESREAAGEEKGENEQLKRSAAIRFVAKLTGMSLEHAYWLAMVVNFAAIAAALVWLSRSHLPGLLRNRTSAIQKSLEEARQASQQANQRLSDIEARLARLDVEIASMQATAEKEAAQEEERIKAAAEEDTRKVIQAAEQEIVAAAKAARRDLKAFAANLAVSLAQKQIRVDQATDQELVRSFADQLGVSHADGARPAKGSR